MPPEIGKLGRTLNRWFNKICNYHHARTSNGPTEALNNLIKRIKRIGFGFRNFHNYRIRALLYAGELNWRVLAPLWSNDHHDPAEIRRAGKVRSDEADRLQERGPS